MRHVRPVTEKFPRTIHVRIEPDRDCDILIAGTDAADALGQYDQAELGVYHLVKVIDARRSVEVREEVREVEAG